MGRHGLRSVGVWAALALGVVLAGASGGCSTNPATGRSSLTFMSWDWEREVGSENAQPFTAEFGGTVAENHGAAGAAVEAYVENVGRKLLPGVEEGVPDLDWEFTLLDSAVINAFALPGGKVFMSRGLAEKLENEAQLAGVLGHEIGHVTARHGNQRMSQAMIAQGLLMAGAAAVSVADENSVMRQVGQIGIPALAVGGNLVILSYGRNQELESDMLGMRYMARAGYDPVGQRGVMEILAQESAGAGRPPAFLSTHPYPEDRIRQIDRLLETEYASARASGQLQVFEDRYEREFLNPIARLGPAKHGREETSLLGTPSLWCAHCRESEALLAQALVQASAPAGGEGRPEN